MNTEIWQFADAPSVTLVTYIIYLVVSIIMTIWIGRSLNRNGRIFLVKNFAGDEAIADSINHLLLVGFYLVNIGFVLLAMSLGPRPTTIEFAAELLSLKVGGVLMLLGLMHFANMFVLIRFNQSKMFRLLSPDSQAARTSAPPQVAPGAVK